MSKEMTPDIRFEGFEDEWEKLLISDFTRLSQGLQIPIDRRFKEPGERREFYITNEFLNPGSKTKYYIQSPSNNVIAHKDNILMTRTGNTGKVVTDVRGAFHNNFFNINYNREIIEKYFLFYSLNTPEIQRDILERAGTSTIPDLNHNEFYKMKLCVPDIQEQGFISKLMLESDNIVDNKHKEITKLQNFKQAMLQKMFPKEGEKEPEVRFEGFSEEWESKKIESIAGRYDNLRIPVTARNRIQGDTPYYGANGIQDYVKGYTHDGSYVLLAEDGASNLADYPVYYVTGKIWVNNHAHVLQGIEGISDNKFLAYALKTIQMERYLVGGSRHKLNASTMMDIELELPTIQEQIKIGNFFKNLDNKIELEEQNLEKLKQFKKAMLQKMFV